MRFSIIAMSLSAAVSSVISSVHAWDDDAPLAPTRQELLDPAWMEATLAEIGIDRLTKLYDRNPVGDAPDDPTLQLVHGALLLSRTFLNEHPEELRSQLQARLLSSDEPELQVFQDLPADRVRARATRPSLLQAGDVRVGVIPITRTGHEFRVAGGGTLIAVLGQRQLTTRPFGSMEAVHILDVRTGELLQAINEGVDLLTLPAGFSPDLTQFYGLTQDGVFHAWNLRTREELWNGLCGWSPYYRVYCVTSPDDRLVAISSCTAQAVVFDSQTGEEVAIIPAGIGEEIWSIGFLDNETLIGNCKDQMFRHWNIESGEVIAEFELNILVAPGGTKGVVLDAKQAESQWLTHAFEIYDTSTGELLTRTEFEKPVQLDSMEFSADGSRLAFGISSPENQLAVYRMDTGEEIATLPLGDYRPQRVVPTSGNAVFTSSSDHTIRVWDVTRSVGEEEAVDRARGLGMTADGGTVMTCSSEYIQLWETATWIETDRFEVHPWFAAMSDDGTRILFNSDREICTLDVATGEVTQLLKTEAERHRLLQVLALSGDGRIGAVNIDDGKAVFFDAVTGEIQTGAEPSGEIVLNYDGSQALLENRLLELSTGMETEADYLLGHCRSMSADGRLAIVHNSYRGNTVLDLTTGEQLKDAAYTAEPGEFLGYPFDTPVALSADGRYSASCSPNFDVHLYDVEERMPVAVVTGDQMQVTSLELSENGSHLLVGTTDGNWHHYRFENLPP
jgi:WD40 repeat protein